MNPALQRGRASTGSVNSFDDPNEHATDYISSMYQQSSSTTIRPPTTSLNPPSIPRKKVVPPPPPPKPVKSNVSSSTSPSYTNSSIQSTPSGSMYQRSLSSDGKSTSPERRSPERKSPALTFPRPPPTLSTQMPLSGLDDSDDGSTPSSPAEIAKELSNLQAFKRMSLDASNQVSDPDLPSKNRIPDISELMEAGVDQDAARLLWVPGFPVYRIMLTVAHLHPEIAANDDWKDFVQRRVEETKTTGTIGRVKSISGGNSQRRLSRSKSILSRQIDPADEDSWSQYSDTGHKELERRASVDKGGPTERHMITVSELEKLEALIKEGALERQGRPLSAESIEMIEATPPLAADVTPPTEDISPLMPMKGTLRRTRHTSMRNVRRGGGARSARRSSEAKKSSRMSQDSASEEDGLVPNIETSSISPTSPLYNRRIPCQRYMENLSHNSSRLTWRSREQAPLQFWNNLIYET